MVVAHDGVGRSPGLHLFVSLILIDSECWLKILPFLEVVHLTTSSEMDFLWKTDILFSIFVEIVQHEELTSRGLKSTLMV